jgi:predicted nucleic acid-binding protein
MTVYADTSWWIAYKSRRDVNHEVAVEVLDRYPDMRCIWTPWHRVELFNAFRQAERINALDSGESKFHIRMLEQEVQLGYWPHVEFSWINAVRTACELSAEFGLRVPTRGMDLFHVAIAIEVGSDALLTFDGDQKSFAEAAGVRVLSLASPHP